jgi:hypothetical protein
MKDSLSVLLDGVLVSIFLDRKNLREFAKSTPDFAYIVRKASSRPDGMASPPSSN